jgi:hypothetical protein
MCKFTGSAEMVMEPGPFFNCYMYPVKKAPLKSERLPDLMTKSSSIFLLLVFIIV